MTEGVCVCVCMLERDKSWVCVLWCSSIDKHGKCVIWVYMDDMWSMVPDVVWCVNVLVHQYGCVVGCINECGVICLYWMCVCVVWEEAFLWVCVHRNMRLLLRLYKWHSTDIAFRSICWRRLFVLLCQRIWQNIHTWVCFFPLDMALIHWSFCQ